jgi:TonB family protein
VRTLLAIAIALSFISKAYCQSNLLSKSDTASCAYYLDSLTNIEVIKSPNQLPIPEGGLPNLYKRISENFKLPSSARRIGIDGKILIGFVIDSDGTVIGKRVIKSNNVPEMGIQALEVVEKTKWSAGTCGNKKVPVILIMPIQICLK